MADRKESVKGREKADSFSTVESGAGKSYIEVIRGMKIMDDAEFTGFERLLKRGERQKKEAKLDWSKVEAPDKVIPYSELKDVAGRELLSKLAILKLNGGLGTSMGCEGPKSVIEVQAGKTFLDLIVEQVEYLNKTYSVDVPLCLMNSFNTHEETDKILGKYKASSVTFHTFNQSCYPRIEKESMLPLSPDVYADDKKKYWYPPGHGDVYQAMYKCGLLDALIKAGKEYIFISNVDNLGATVDLNILAHLFAVKSDFAMEVTDKTRADVKGGTLIKYEGATSLLEIAQVEKKYVEEFKSIKKFKIFNTNNLWVGLHSMKKLVEEDKINAPVIFNYKKLNGKDIVQLETASGAAIGYFSNGIGINVPRSRFLPVKSTSDLFLVQSNLFTIEHGFMNANVKRVFPTLPLIKLGSHFTFVADFQKRFTSIPDLLELDHLTITGDVKFGPKVVLRGTVIIVVNDGDSVELPEGSVLENKVVTGHLKILDH